METLAFCFEMESVIVESLCNRIFQIGLCDHLEKEETKEMLITLKEVQAATKFSQTYCDKFVDELNRLYETYFLRHTTNHKLNTSSDLLLPLEFSSFFFKSLTTHLLNTICEPKWSVIKIIETNKILLESAVNHKRLFMISSILNLAVHYLRLRIRIVKSLPDDKNEKFDVIPLSIEEYFAVFL